MTPWHALVSTFELRLTESGVLLYCSELVRKWKGSNSSCPRSPMVLTLHLSEETPLCLAGERTQEKSMESREDFKLPCFHSSRAEENG